MSAQPMIVICNDSAYLPQAEVLAQALDVNLVQNCDPQSLAEPEFALMLDEQGIALQQTGRKAPGPIRAEFAEGSVDHRRKFGGGKGQMIAKAVGVKAGVYPRVLDATAGLGKDAFVLATLGCHLQMLERSPVAAPPAPRLEPTQAGVPAVASSAPAAPVHAANALELSHDLRSVYRQFKAHTN